MKNQCAPGIECKLLDIQDLPANAIYIGEVIDAYAGEKYFMDYTADIKKMNSAFLTVPDNRKWRGGNITRKRSAKGNSQRKAKKGIADNM
jgi:flavin reductase (DIM6/NTAB) family NADH-FMN oxidoreductase RutF